MPLLYGSDLAGFDRMKSMSFQPTYLMKWIGKWSSIGSDGTVGDLTRFLNDCKTRGATPVVLFYYWGDGISDTVLKNGTADGSKTPAKWWTLGKAIAKTCQLAANEKIIVVPENEMNKANVTPEVIDPMLRDMGWTIKNAAPNRVLICSGTGSWASTDIYSKYPGILQSSDILGTQLMRGLTKDSREKYEASGEFIATWCEAIHTKHPDKPQLVFDTTFSTYGLGQPAILSWPEGQAPSPTAAAPPSSSKEEALAARAIRSIKEREQRLLDAKVLGFLFREPKDHIGRIGSTNYYLAAEYFMGWAQRTDGSGKTELLEAMRVFMDSSAPVPTPEPAPVDYKPLYEAQVVENTALKSKLSTMQAQLSAKDAKILSAIQTLQQA